LGYGIRYDYGMFAPSLHARAATIDALGQMG